MGADNLKYDPALGVYDEASLRAAGRYLDALHYEINGREDWIGDEYFRCERMLIAVERAISAHDHGIDEDDRYYKKPDQQDKAAAEIGRLRGEVDARISPDWVIGYFPADVAEEVKRAVRDAFGEWNALSPKPAPAMPNGVEADWKCIISVLEHGMRDGIHGGYNASYIKQQIKALRAADNRDAAGADHALGFTFGVGGSISIDDTTTEGVYTGNFDVTAEYN